MAQNSEPALALLVLLLLSVASLAWSPASIADRHEAWMAKFGRRYKDDETKQKRMEIFRDNIAFIEAFNQAGNDTIELGENQFADLTEEEFKAGFIGFKPLAVANDLPFRYANVTKIPSIVDWRLKGAVTPIKNQGSGCGSCWAFSSIATVEAIHKIKTGQLISLSEQELVDCDTHDEGCIGGTLYGPYQYILESNGIATESAYPYQWKAQPCNRTKLPPRAVTIKGFEAPPSYDEDAMAKAVANQPIAVGMAINGPAFQFYKRGVITQNCGTVLKHSIAIVGYGKSKRGVEFWLAKNQWGAWWGEGGYVRIARNHGVPQEGVCMIAVSAAYPVVD